MPKKEKKRDKEIHSLLSNDVPPPNFNPAELENELLDLLGEEEPEEEVKSTELMDENDPRLLAELEAFVSGDDPAPSLSDGEPMEVDKSDKTKGLTLSQVDERIAIYFSAIDEIQSINPVDTVKVGRYERGLQQLQSLSSRIEERQTVRPDELPPVPPKIGLPAHPTQPVPEPETLVSRVANPPTKPETTNTVATVSHIAPGALDAFKNRCQEYKLAAIKARDNGDITSAKDLLQVFKALEEIVPLIEGGQESFDPASDMPPTPEEYLSSKAEDDDAPSAGPSTPAPAPTPRGAMTHLTQVSFTPDITLENIQSRIAYYEASMEEAKSNQNSGLARRLGRVLTQYTDALKAIQHNVSGFNFAELPPPPKCPALTRRAAPSGHSTDTESVSTAGATTGDKKRDRIVKLLHDRQVELKAAALEAKEEGDMELAKIHLRGAMSLKGMIESVNAGIAVDLSKVPRAPSAADRGSGGAATAAFMGAGGSGAVVAFRGPVMTGQSCETPMHLRLELEADTNERDRQQRLLQLIHAQTNEAADTAKLLAQVDQTELSRKMIDLAQLGKSSVNFFTSAIRQGRVASYSFEWANIPKVNMNYDLGDSVIEISRICGVSFPLPSDISHAEKLDTYVDFMLPVPSAENAQKQSTEWVKHTNNPEYANAVLRFDVDTKSRSFQYLVKNNRTMKGHVYYSRGFLRSPKLLGTINFPLGGMAQSATLNLTGDLMEGRRALGGILKIQLRQRSCISGPQVTAIRKPWLVLALPRTSPQNSSSQRSTGHQVSAQRPTSPPRLQAPSVPRIQVENDSKRRFGSDRDIPNSMRGLSPPESPLNRTMNTGLPRSRSHSGAHTNQQQPQPQQNSRQPSSGVPLCSLAIMMEDRDQFKRHLSRPQLPLVDREKYQPRLNEVERRINVLQDRLQSPSELELYKKELRTMAEKEREQFDLAQRNQDIEAIEHRGRRLKTIRQELDSYYRR